MTKRRKSAPKSAGRTVRTTRQRELDLGWRGAEDGMKRAARHADDDAPGWADRALIALNAYMRAHPAETFIAPSVRAWALRHGLDAPRDAHAWGVVFRRAARAKLIRRAGFQQYGDATTNTQPVSVWRPVDYGPEFRA